MTSAAHSPAREQWLTLQQACALVGVSPATLRRWSANGDIRTFTTPGGHRRFARSAIVDLLPAASEPAQAPLPSLLALTAHARRVPSAAREAFARELTALERSPGAIVVHTCHRVELYIALETLGERALPRPPEGSQRLEGLQASRHLISVACGLDSAVLCENQLLHQLRETFTRRRAAHPLDPVLDRLFQVALQAGRRARSRFGNPPRSLADVALERITELGGALQGRGAPEGRRILIVGAGVMGRLAALAAARQGAKVIVSSRTEERASALAREVGGHAIPFEGDADVAQLAGAIVALGGSWPLAEEHLRALGESGAIVVDMSSPVAVPESLRAALGERFVSADDLAWQDGAEPPGGPRTQLEALAEQFTDSYSRWLRTRNSVPVIQAIGEAAEERRREALTWLFRRLPALNESERSLVEQMSHRLVADVLHAPRSALNADEGGRLAQAARELFGT